MQATRRILADLWWTLAPLLVPGLGILLIASLAWPVLLAVAAALGVVIVIAGGLFRLWHRDGHRAIRSVARTPPYMLLTALFGIVLLSALVFRRACQPRSLLTDTTCGAEFWSPPLRALGARVHPPATGVRDEHLSTPARGGLRDRVHAVLPLLFVGGDTALTIFDHLIWAGLLTGLLALCAIDERSQGAPYADGRPGISGWSRHYWPQWSLSLPGAWQCTPTRPSSASSSHSRS